MRIIVGNFVAVAAVIFGAWFWLARPVPMPSSPLSAGEKLDCISYAPFRGDQSPLDPATQVTPQQYEEDMARLAAVTKCVRTYSMEFGLETVPEIAARHGLKVLTGLWLSSDRAKNRREMEAAIAVANKHPDTIIGVVVGNEVLLRGEMNATELAANIREVKSKVRVPVTYADVWEFWLRNRDIHAAVDFVTIHILPYWEDFPIPARDAANHVRQIRARVAAELPGKDILVGETGWPSAGRMREGALPSPANQALVVQGILAAAKADGFRVNVIEAFDQPWKRRLEGTVGGHWGLYEDRSRNPKFVWGQPVSNHGLWPFIAGAGIGVAGLIFGAAVMVRRGGGEGARVWLLIGAMATIAGVMAPWSVQRLSIESLTPFDWVRTCTLLLLCLAVPTFTAIALVRGRRVASFAEILNRPHEEAPPVRGLTRWLGLGLMLTTIVAIQVALGLVFDPRYRDFPFAPMTAILAAYLALRLTAWGEVRSGPAEAIAAIVLVACSVYIVLNETVANWQALWFAATLVVLSLILWRGPGDRSSR